MLEFLESRRLLAVTHTLVDGTLTVYGTPLRDKISVVINNVFSGWSAIIELKQRTIVVSGFVPGASGTLPDRVVINGGDGADRLSVWQYFYKAPVTVHGGAGADDIDVGGTDGFRARVFGDSGNDNILLNGSSTGVGYSPWNHDFIVRGGAGHDVIEVRDFRVAEPKLARVRILGDEGNDHVTGSDGPDHLFGGAGDDTLIGADGEDILLGGTGKNQLIQDQ